MKFNTMRHKFASLCLYYNFFCKTRTKTSLLCVETSMEVLSIGTENQCNLSSITFFTLFPLALVCIFQESVILWFARSMLSSGGWAPIIYHSRNKRRLYAYWTYIQNRVLHTGVAKSKFLPDLPEINTFLSSKARQKLRTIIFPLGQNEKLVEHNQLLSRLPGQESDYFRQVGKIVLIFSKLGIMYSIPSRSARASHFTLGGNGQLLSLVADCTV